MTNNSPTGSLRVDYDLEAENLEELGLSRHHAGQASGACGS